MDLEIYLCRHGETEWTLSGQHTSRTDLPLNQKGHDQAMRLKHRLGDVSWDEVISSPMKRCLMTAQIIGFNKPDLEPRAVEWNYGNYEGLTSDKIGGKWCLFTDGAPNGESPEQVSARADGLVADLKKKKGRILLFSHGHFIRVLAVRWMGLPVAAGHNFALSVASLSCLGFERGQPALRLWNDTSHLETL